MPVFVASNTHRYVDSTWCKFIDVYFAPGLDDDRGMPVHFDVVVRLTTHVQDPQIRYVDVAGPDEYDDFWPAVHDHDRVYAAAYCYDSVQQLPHRPCKGR